jgi:hypothetical protein
MAPVSDYDQLILLLRQHKTHPRKQALCVHRVLCLHLLSACNPLDGQPDLNRRSVLTYLPSQGMRIQSMMHQGAGALPVVR